MGGEIKYPLGCRSVTDETYNATEPPEWTELIIEACNADPSESCVRDWSRVGGASVAVNCPSIVEWATKCLTKCDKVLSTHLDWPEVPLHSK